MLDLLLLLQCIDPISCNTKEKLWFMIDSISTDEGMEKGQLDAKTGSMNKEIIVEKQIISGEKSLG